MQPLPTKGKYRILAEINMIPFIDVALVLLIIFMVMTPFLVRSQIKVNLPKARTVEAQVDRDRILRVMVDRAGRVYIEDQPVPPEDVEAALRRLIRDPADRPVLIEADKDVPFQGVVTVLDAAKKIGVARLSVCVTQEANRKGSKAPR